MKQLKLLLLLALIVCSLDSQAQKVKVSLQSGAKAINENCALVNNEKIQFALDSKAKIASTYKITLGGTATNTIDYVTNLTDSIVFNIGDSVKLFDLSVFNDKIDEGPETIIIRAINPMNSDTLLLTINDHILQFAFVQDTFTQCSNAPFNLHINQALGANISFTPNDVVSITKETGTYRINPIRTTQVIFTGSMNNCFERDTFQVISLPIGVTLNTKDTAFLCFPDSILLLANVVPASANVGWSPIDSNIRVLNKTSIRVVPIKSKQIIVNVSSGVCAAADTVMVIIDSLRETKIQVIPKKDKYCKGDSIFFVSRGHPKDLFPAISPHWSPADGFQTPIDTFNAVLMATMTHWYSRLTENHACRHIDSVYIKVVEPSIPVGPVDTTVCPGTTVQINFNQDSSVYKDFKWTPQDGLISCEKCPNPKIKVNGPQMYKVQAKKDGCDAETMIKADVFQKPPVGIGTNPAPPFIAGNDISISLLNTQGFKAVNWSIDGKTVAAGQLTGLLSKATPGNHTVEATVTDRNGCQWGYLFTLIVTCPSNNLKLNLSPANQVYEGTKVTVTATGVSANVTNIKWTVNNSSLSGSGFSVEDRPTQAGDYVYQFSATDVNGCPLIKSISLKVIPCIDAATLRNKIPNAFSPNGDMKNDYFIYVDPSLQILKLVIYNRWGELVYNNTNPGQGWDGNYGGQPAPQDTYIYRMTYICGQGSEQTVSGPLELIR